MSVGEFYRRVLPETCVDLAAADGRARFASSLSNNGANCFFSLIAQVSSSNVRAGGEDSCNRISLQYGYPNPISYLTLILTLTLPLSLLLSVSPSSGRKMSLHSVVFLRWLCPSMLLLWIQGERGKDASSLFCCYLCLIFAFGLWRSSLVFDLGLWSLVFVFLFVLLFVLVLVFTCGLLVWSCLGLGLVLYSICLVLIAETRQDLKRA